MIIKKSRLKLKIARFLKKQKIAVLATTDKKEPYESLVAFTMCDNLQSIVFATERGTRKYSNIKAKSAVALLVDDRANTRNDFYKTTVVTVVGKAVETRGRERLRLLREHTVRHNHIREFLASKKCAIFRIRVRVYYVVSSFDNVEKVTP